MGAATSANNSRNDVDDDDDAGRHEYEEGEYDRVLAARIACYMLCCSCFQRRRKSKRGSAKDRGHRRDADGAAGSDELEGFTSEPPTKSRGLLWIGPAGAGKSSILERVQSLTVDEGLGAPYGSALPEVEETRGFSIKDTRHRDVNFRIWDLGGSAKIRPYWGAYLHNAHALVYTIEARHAAAPEEAFDALLEFYLAHPSARNLPLLVLSNVKSASAQGLEEDENEDALRTRVESGLRAKLDGMGPGRIGVFVVNALPQGTSDTRKGHDLRSSLWAALDYVRASTL